MASKSWPDRLYRGLLRLFPAEFRGDFGDQMKDDFIDQRGDAVRGGRGALVGLWLRTGWDFFRRGPREHLDIFIRDAAFGLRVLRRRPGFAASTLLTLAIGIGLNTAVFSVVDTVLVRDLPFANGDRLVRVFELGPAPERETTDVSPANFIDWATATRTLDAIGQFGGSPGTLITETDPEWIVAMTVSEGLLDMLGERPLHGRLFTPADYAAAHKFSREPDPRAKDRAAAPAPNVIILSHDVWQRLFHGNPRVLGSKYGSVETPSRSSA